uniref:F-box/kelch-repeat protein At3g17530 family n=1 Tax=Cajanus cajan TaxID=3821 RepID=A0A151RQN4_CAJCA|nr:F-box/kelch-repeat protein At3g17530 family [Cajanus cajan]
MKKVETLLNGDVLIEILSRIPAKELVSLKRVCREWRRVISSRSFAKVHVGRASGGEVAALTGFVFQERFVWCSDDIRTVSYIPLATRGVHHSVLDFLPEDVVVLASCRGSYPCESPVVYVCNPCNRDWVKLDWPWHVSQFGRSNNRTIALALAFEIHPSKGFIDTFKLVRVEKVEEGERYFKFELYEKGSWRESSEICNCYNNLVKNEGIYIRGVLHWLTDGDRVLTFDVEKELAWLVPVPVPAAEFTAVPEACIGESEGRLHYVVVSEQGFHVWNRVLERVNGPWVNPLAFKDGFLLMKVCVSLYLYDVNNNKMVQACSIKDLRSLCMFNPTVLPYSLSLVPLTSIVKGLKDKQTKVHTSWFRNLNFVNRC